MSLKVTPTGQHQTQNGPATLRVTAHDLAAYATVEGNKAFVKWKNRSFVADASGLPSVPGSNEVGFHEAQGSDKDVELEEDGLYIYKDDKCVQCTQGKEIEDLLAKNLGVTNIDASVDRA